MSVLHAKEAPALTGPAEPPPIYLDARAEFASRFLTGEGLEIGPLHQPLRLPKRAKARYVDRMTVEELRREYDELAGWKLTPVDVIDDGETLATVAPESQDFIVANHFLEHCENPIGTIETHLGKLRPGGILFYAVPDKRYTFDFRRPAVRLEHVIADYQNGPAGSRRDHYEEWTRLVLGEGAPSDERATAKARELEDAKYSIHMHAWTQAEFLAMVLDCRQRFADAFDIEAAARQGIEFVVVLRKQGPPPQAIAPPGTALGALARFGSKLRRRTAAVLRHQPSR